jgi:hypothetical protein
MNCSTAFQPGHLQTMKGMGRVRIASKRGS